MLVAEADQLKPGPGLYVVDPSLRLSVETQYKTEPKRKAIGWSPGALELVVWGRVSSADQMLATWKNKGKVVGTTSCETPEVREAGGQGEVRCGGSDEVVFPGTGTFEVELAIKSAETGTVTPLRKLVFRVGKYVREPAPNPVEAYYVDLDYRMAETFVVWQTKGLAMHSWVKLATQSSDVENGLRTGKVTCTVDGAPLKEYSNGLRMENSFTIEDRSAGLNADWKITKWLRLSGHLWTERGGDYYKPGAYECKLLASGKVWRVFRFKLDKDLRVVTGPEQTKTLGALATGQTYVDTVEFPEGIDAPYDKAALSSLAFMGRPWLASAPAR